MTPSTRKLCTHDIALYDNRKNAPAILFIHGLCFWGGSFKKQFSSEALKDYRLVALDLPGHGTSTRNVAAYPLLQLRKIIEELIQELALQQVVLAGNSLGGHLSIDLAEKLTPVKGAVIYGAPPVSMLSDFGQASHPHPASQYVFQGNLTDEQIILMLHAYMGVKDDISDFVWSARNTDDRFKATLLHDFMNGGLLDEISLVKALTKPLAVFHGDMDLINAKYIEELSMPSLWRNKVHHFTEAGHYVHWEVPEAFNDLLHQFVSEIMPD